MAACLSIRDAEVPSLHAIECESQLSGPGLLHPQGAVVVERSDALGGRHEIRRTLSRHSGYEI